MRKQNSIKVEGNFALYEISRAVIAESINVCVVETSAWYYDICWLSL